MDDGCRQTQRCVLTLEEIRYRYGADHPWAVDGVSFALARGEILGLLGPNGAGKSTLLSLIAGLRQPTSGRIERAPEAQVRGGFALVPQDHAFYPMLTCRENLAFFAGVLGLAGARRRDQIERAITATGLERVRDRRASECSGGLRRRLNLAIGLLGEPVLVLLDEPTVGVDPQSRAFLLDVVRALRDTGAAVVYTSHYMEEVQAISDRVAIIDHGRLLCCGSLPELLASSDGTLAIQVDAVPSPAQRAILADRAGLLPTDERDSSRLLFALARDYTVEKTLALLREQGLRVSNIQYGLRNLEDLFLRLTHRSLRD